jgi:putative thioredoxin
MPAIDVTDATFEAEVVERSRTTPVVIDLWAEWCGPCKVLGPILEKVTDDTGGKVALAKIDIESNPGLAQAFRVQSIPAVFVAVDGKVAPAFVGAQPEHVVRQFVESLVPSEEHQAVTALLAAGDEASLRQALDLEPGNEAAIVALADLLAGAGSTDEALALLERIPESADTRRIAAKARMGAEAASVGDGVEAKLDALLERLKDDEAARQEFLDTLELLGPADERTARYRRAMASRLF